ncbi:MAG: DNA-binding response regulator, partial [Candidatus Dadabacteria bacterium]
HIPEVNGFEFVKRLRKCANPLISQVNVLILTSDEDIEAELQGFNVGVDDFIRKDIDPRILSARVKRFLSKIDGQKAGAL